MNSTVCQRWRELRTCYWRALSTWDAFVIAAGIRQEVP